MTFNQPANISQGFDSVISRLNAEDSDDRRWAVYNLESFEPSETVDYLVQAVQDDNRAVREAASEVLETIPSDLCVERLVPLLGSVRIEVRNIVASILVSFSDHAVNDLLPAFTHENEDVRKFAADILGLAGSPKAVQVLCKVAIEDEVENVSISAVEALGKIGSKEALPSLFQLFDKDNSLKLESAEAIGLIGGPESAKFLEDRLEGSDDQLINFAIVDALGNIGNESSLSLLKTYLEQAPSIIEEHVCRAILKIGRSNNTNVLNNDQSNLCEIIVSLLDVQTEDIADLVTFQISLSPDNDVIMKLFKYVDNLPSTLIVSLINTAKNKKEFINALCALADHKDEWVAYTAIEALGNFEREMVKGTLLDVMKVHMGLPVIAAIRTSVKLQIEEAKPILQYLGKSENEDIKGEALQALSEFGLVNLITNNE